MIFFMGSFPGLVSPQDLRDASACASLRGEPLRMPHLLTAEMVVARVETVSSAPKAFAMETFEEMVALWEELEKLFGNSFIIEWYVGRVIDHALAGEATSLTLADLRRVLTSD